MQPSLVSRLKIATTVLVMSTFAPAIASATIVEVDTNLGTFQVNLYDNDTPQTVANFLAYVQNGDYNNSVFHRSVFDFIVQGGGVVTDGNANLSFITERPTVQNEPVFANIRGTIAMAKRASGPSTATSQWFINLSNNTSNLDNQNGGSTVFGEVTGAGMLVLDDIEAVPTFDGVFGLNDFPLQNFVAAPVVNDNLVIVNSITVIDTNVDSAAGLNPTPTTRTNGGGNGGGGGGGGGGGSAGWLTLFGLLVLGRRRYGVLKAS